MSDKREESRKEMENIQKNLEYFLEQEIRNSIETSSRNYEDTVSKGYQEYESERVVREETKASGPEYQQEDFEEERPMRDRLLKEGPNDKAFTDGKASPKKKRDSKRKEHPQKDSVKKERSQKKKHTKKEADKEKSRRRIKKESVQNERLENKKSGRGRDEDLSKKRQSGKRSYEEQEEERKSGFGKFLSVLICFFVLLGIAWYVGMSGIYGKMEYNRTEQLADESMKDRGVVNILLIGTDARSSEEAGRSDAMILLSVSPKTKTVHMTSLLRDMYVEIPGHDGNRLNAAYAYGGPELLLETVSLNFDMDVNRYIVVDFRTFANLVDAVGGVDIELSNEEVQWVNAYLNEYNMLRDMPLETDYLDTSLSGVIHLNGPQALAYSRNRYIGSDFGRTERQRKVLGAVADNIGTAIVKNPMELLDGVFSELTTNLTKSECLQLSLMSGKLLTYDIIQGSIPLSGTYRDATIRGMAVLEVDFEKNKEYIRSEIYGE